MKCVFLKPPKQAHFMPLTQQVDTVVNPLKKTVSSVGNMVKSMPDNIVDGVVKVSGGIRSIPSNMIDGVGKMLNVKPVINLFRYRCLTIIIKPNLVLFHSGLNHYHHVF